ncbi:8654_t:CDS:2 [Gigaspora rosea]|nr:8654_t:CDS:2 [Gigaspora rosea]
MTASNLAQSCQNIQSRSMEGEYWKIYMKKEIPIKKIFSVQVEVSNIRSELHKNWPDVKFERSRDQFEYNALCAIGNNLNLAFEYGYEVAFELPQSKSESLSVYEEMIE